jgi:hypothetical protein
MFDCFYKINNGMNYSLFIHLSYKKEYLESLERDKELQVR